ncbi:Putative DNA glycosylase [Tolypocladium paradoxum]|uniref:DNA glycosylase n=1 Tax=Tolypocladium paradoxum TaxID=94208 RepID=A0A2S4KPB4_9HYPO|nr:Putative DNA glycosylase [Tolypocladium paradoxum]
MASTTPARRTKTATPSLHPRRSPFPGFAHPTPDECVLAHGILTGLHGDRARPEHVLAPTAGAGCGSSPSVLDALVRTALSHNTSGSNSSRAKQSIDAVYGGSNRWDAISRIIIGILQQAKARPGAYSLDHLFAASEDDAMREMLSFPGVGPKTAGCVLLLCLRRAIFAVDTHAHLDATAPDEEKYPLHVLLVSHGKQCDECKAGGKNLGRCELRRAFGEARLEGKETTKGEVEATKRDEDSH